MGSSVRLTRIGQRYAAQSARGLAPDRSYIAIHRARHLGRFHLCHAAAGWMFWFMRNKFVGSYCCLS